MENIVRSISTAFLEKLPTENEFYQPKDFTEAGFPDFLTQRITSEIEERMLRSAEIAVSDWIDLDSDIGSEAWQQFLNSVKKDLKLPVHAAGEVITRSVENCLKLAVQPRKTVPALLFGGKKEIGFRELKNRVAAITVNSHLAYAIVRYMEKRELETLTIDKAKTVVNKIDQKLVSDYNPLNWLEILKPVYTLAGPSVDSNLLRIFFEEKEKHSAAKKFDLLEKTIEETEFIEVMSSADLLEIEGYTDYQQQLFEETEEETDSDIETDDEPELKSDQTEEEETDTTEEADDLNELFKTEQEDESAEETPVDADAEEELETKAEIFEESEVDDEVEDVIAEEEPEEEEEDDESLNRLFAHADSDIAKEEVEEDEGVPFEPDEEIAETDEDDEPSAEEPEKKTSGEENESESDVIEEPVQTDEEIFEEDTENVSESVETESEEVADEEDENVPLLNRFMFDDSPDEEEEDENQTRDSIYSELNLVREDREEMTLRDLFSQEPDEEDSDTEDDAEMWVSEDDDDDEDHESEDSRAGLWANNVFEEEDDEESEPEEEISPPFVADEDEHEDYDDADVTDDVPMWKSFLEREDTDDEPGFRFDDDESEDKYEDKAEEEVPDEKVLDEEELDEDGFIEEPIFDLTRDGSEEEISRIANWMKDEEDKFIEEIFGNSEAAYEQALAEIENFEKWKNASKFIEREIFSRNRIDVYDEIAVDFTDRLHTYFLEYKS